MPGGNAGGPLVRWPGREPLSPQPRSEAGLGLHRPSRLSLLRFLEQAGGKKVALGASFHLAALI